MARQVLPIVGAVVGAFFGAPQIGFAIGSIIGNAVDPLVIEGPKIGETPMQTSAEGVTRPIVFGTAPVMGNVIAAGDKIIKKKKERQGKGGPVTVTERLYQTFAVRICEGPIVTITRIWEDEKLVMDVRPESTIPAETAEFLGRLRIYIGDETQMPDPDLEIKYGAGNTPAYRGTCYAVFPMADLTDRRGSFPNYRWEVATNATVEEAPTAIILGRREADPPGNSAPVILGSSDGLDWSGDYSAEGFDELFGIKNKLATGIGALIAWREQFTEPPIFSLDKGNTWTESATTIVGRQSACFVDGAFLIASTSGVYRSFDLGQSYTHVTGPVVQHLATVADSRVINCNTGGDGLLRWTTDKGNTWNVGSAHGMAAGGGGIGVESSENFAYFGGSEVAVVGPPRLIRTADGVTVIVESLPAFVDSAAIRAIAVNEAGRKVVVTDTGEIGYFDPTDSLWHLSDDTLGTDFTGTDCQWNGSVFIACGINVASIGVIKTSPTGEVWTTRPTANVLVPFQIAIVEPDAPEAISEPATLSDIVANIHQRCGHTTSQYDVSELTDEVNGIVLAGDYTGASAIRSFMPVYFFDAADYDKKVRYHKRGKPVVRTLTIDNLVDEPEEATRENAIEYPKKVNLAYQNPVVGYAPAKASTVRSSPDVRVVGERNLQVPVCMTTDAAAQISDKLMKVMWAEADGEVKFTVSDKELDLVPSDCIGLSLRGTSRRLRVDQVEINPGTLLLTCRNDRQSAYTSNVTGVPVPLPTPPPPSIAGATVFAFLDISALIDTNDTLNYYVAASGVNEAWFGALIQRKTQNATDFEDATTFSAGTVMGVLLDDITDASEHYTDTTNIVRVSLYDNATLDSLTQQQFLSEGGAFALEKADGTWELMQYRDAEEDSNGDWLLSTLLRGRLNSGTSSHTAGVRFVLLDGVRLVPAQSAWLDTDLTHRAVSFNTSPETAVEYVNEYTGQSQTEWPCAHLFLERDGDNLLVSTVPRHRFGTEDAPVRSSNFEGFHWEASDGTNISTRDTTSPDTVFNTLGWGSPITVTVCAVNRITANGPTISEQIA